MTIPWDLIIEAAIELILDCINDNSNEATVIAALISPGPLQYLRLRRKLRALGIRGRQLNETMSAVRNQVIDTTDAEAIARSLYAQALDVRAERVLDSSKEPVGTL